MKPEDPSRAWRRVQLRRALLAFATLASAALAVVLGFAGCLFVAGFSGGSNPQSVAPLAFPLSFLLVILVGLPVAAACVIAWAGYLIASRR